MKRMIAWLSILLLLTSCTPVVSYEPEPLSLEAHGVTLTVGMSEREVLAQLGDGYTVKEAESCAGEGVDRMYTYPSLRIYVFAPTQGEARVTSVSYTDDGVSTGALRIGCSEQDVWAALGKPDEAGEGVMIYRRATSVLTVTLRDGRASSIVLSEE